MDFLRIHQLSLMLVMAGICIAVTFCGVFLHSSKRKKMSLLIMGTSAAVMMIADRYAYIYRGNESTTGYYMVRICNFLVFLLVLTIQFSANWYISDLCRSTEVIGKVPVQLKINEAVIAIGTLLLIVSQFTGLYYTFDESNHYQRSSAYALSYLIPFIVWTLLLSVVLRLRHKVSGLLFGTLVFFTAFPMISACLQLYMYGLSLINIAIVAMTAAFCIVEIISNGRELTAAHEREKELLVKEQKNMRRMVMQSASALASAIDAKDRYTHGHSRRVAEYSEMIAEMYGKTDSECRDIYLAGLLHDVGKIGIPDGIINKDGRLTDEEFEIIKTHPAIGAGILKKMDTAPFISIGAHYHHERYDGRGYPEGLKGEEIPEIARIIAVADAYDAMTSKRSYRDRLPQEVVRSEIEKGRGTQFDPKFAEIMLGLMDRDTDYQLQQDDEYDV